MAASTTQNPTIRTDSKSTKKKKAAKSEQAPTSASKTITPTEANTSGGAAESSSGDGSYESPYIKELYKNIRNVNKKIANASRVDNILADNPDKSLDDLVAARKINADQKAQILKKPALQASLTQLEEQIAQYKKFDQEYKARSQAEKAEFEKTHNDRSEKALSEAVTAAKTEASAAANSEQQNNMLLLSQFLRLAAARRAEEADSTLDENQALEGVLLSVYSGDGSAVATMIKLIEGSDDVIYAVTGEKLQTTYAEVKAAALAHAPTLLATESTTEDTYNSPTAQTIDYPIDSDPTIAHAALTELNAPTMTSLANGHDETSDASPSVVPQNSGIDEGAANVAAESSWDPNTTPDLSASQEWVDVSITRESTETEMGTTATIASPSNTQGWAASGTQSWADDQPEDGKAEVSPGNDGFHEVHRTRGGRDRDGQFRGRGRGGDNGGYRGRGGFRGGDSGYRGRGRGGPRGGGAPRGRRPDES